jgi:uncharacterized membrane protein YagU involved in acid resistance
MRTTHSSSVFVAVLLGGLIAGTIDIGAAALINSASPYVIMQAIAGGVLGKDSFHEGLPAAALGVFAQWLMSLLIAWIFVFSTRWLPGLKRWWLPAGLAYGIPVFFVMNYVVVPLSALKHTPHFTATRFAENMLAMMLFGVIVAFFTRRAPL